MPTLETLEAQLAQLIAIRGGGVRRLTTDGRTVEYAPGPELEKAISDVRREIATLGGRRSRVIRSHAVKDL